MPDPMTNEWWLERLVKKYVKDQEARSYHASLYDSTNSMPGVPEKAADVYKRLLQVSKTPWGRLVIDIVAERLVLQGFNVGDDSDAADELWNLFRRNRVEAVQRQVHREGLALGTTYASVWETDDGQPRIAFESAMAMTHENFPGDPNRVAAAVKVWYDAVEEIIRANLFMPDATYRVRSTSKYTEESWRNALPNVRWDSMDDRPEVTNIFDDVPIVPFVTRPNWEGYGTSDLEDLAPAILRIESLTASTMLAVELGAFRQKWATGVEIPEDEAGNPVEVYKAAVDRVWISQEPDSRFGAFDATDVRPYLQAISDAIGQLSAVSRIPTLYFNQSDLSNPPSAASLEASETGLINRVMERRDRFQESWEQVARMAAPLGGIDLADDSMIDVVWRDPRTRSEAQVMDAAVKLSTIQVPWKYIMEFIGYTKSEIAAMEAARAADTFNRLLNTPLPSATRIEQQPPAATAEETDDGE